MLDDLTYVDGDNLVAFILGVRDRFSAGDGSDFSDDRPNSVHLVAIELFESLPADTQLAIVQDLLQANPSLLVKREGRDVFAYSDTPAAYLTDLVCEVTWQVLERDPTVRTEHHRRLALAADFQ
jgi:hypothetical protein